MMPILTIYLAATDKNEFQQCIKSIREADLKEKTELLVMHTLEKEWLKPYLHENLNEKKNLSIKIKKIKTEYAYPYDSIRFFPLRSMFRIRFLQKKVKPYREVNLMVQRMAYSQSIPKVHGRYQLILHQQMRLNKDFWDLCITPLKQHKKATILVASVERVNVEKIPYNRVSEKLEFYKNGRGVLPFLLGTQVGEKLIVVRRKRLPGMHINFIWPDISSDKYIFDHAVACRFALSAGILQHSYVAKVDVTEEDIKGYESLETAVLRLAFLKGYVWHYSVPHGYRYKTDDLKEAYQNALDRYGESIEKIEQFYRKNEKFELADRYKAFLAAITD
jgi:hypothetical protein